MCWLRRREGEGWERVRQSGRLSGVWTCLAACTKQRKGTEICRAHVSATVNPEVTVLSYIYVNKRWLLTVQRRF